MRVYGVVETEELTPDYDEVFVQTPASWHMLRLDAKRAEDRGMNIFTEPAREWRRVAKAAIDETEGTKAALDALVENDGVEVLSITSKNWSDFEMLAERMDVGPRTRRVYLDHMSEEYRFHKFTGGEAQADKLRRELHAESETDEDDGGFDDSVSVAAPGSFPEDAELGEVQAMPVKTEGENEFAAVKGTVVKTGDDLLVLDDGSNAHTVLKNDHVAGGFEAACGKANGGRGSSGGGVKNVEFTGVSIDANVSKAVEELRENINQMARRRAPRERR